MRSSMLPLLITVLAGCSDDRGLPQGFLERAAQSPEVPAASPSAAPATTDVAMGASPIDAPTTTDADSWRAPVLSGSAASDGTAVAEADRATTAIVAAVAKDLGLAAPVDEPTPTGDAPHQKLAQDHRFDGFRSECRRYHQLRRALLPFGEKLASGAATVDERRSHDRLEEAVKAEQLRLSRMMWRQGLSADDRAAMSWIMFGPTAAVPAAARGVGSGQ